MSSVVPLVDVLRAYEAPAGEPSPTGFEWLDGPLKGGLRPAQCLVVGAKTNVGKSRSCLGMVLRRALAGHHSLYVSAEDGPEIVGERVAGYLKGLRDHEKGMVHRYTSFAFAYSVPDVVRAVESADSEVSLVFVDYLQALAPEDIISLMAAYRDIHNAVRARGCGWVLASQVTPQVSKEGREILPPNAYWIRACKSLANVAHAVVMLWSEYGEVKAILDKNKNGEKEIVVTLPVEAGGFLLGDGLKEAQEAEW